MENTAYVIGAIAIMGLVTLGLRALPFVAGRWLRRQGWVHKLGATLPLAIMTLLLVHSVADAARQNPAGAWQETLAVALTALLQWRSRNTLLSIVAGTALYVALRNMA
jgi:branched-subunit amino acid transport protein AzlD